MLWVLAGLWLVAVCLGLALILVVVDELRRPPSNVRRAGALIALVTGFASLWLLFRPPAAPPGCPAPVMALAGELGAAGCPSGWPNTWLGLGAAVLSVASVLATRSAR